VLGEPERASVPPPVVARPESDAVAQLASPEPAAAPPEARGEPQGSGPQPCDEAPARAGGERSWIRWTASRLRTRIEEVFGIDVCKETIRRALHRLGLSWKKAKKLLAKADPEKRRAFITDIRALLDRVLHEEDLVLAYIDEAHVHQDADLGHGWSPRGRRLYVASSSPGLSAKVSFYGIYLYSEGQTRIWPYPRANGEHTIDVLQRLRAELLARSGMAPRTIEPPACSTRLRGSASRSFGCRPTAPTSCPSKRSGAGCARA
jgi:hypothetical protein